MNLEKLIYTVVYDYLWGTPLIILVLATGLYFTLRSGFLQFRFFKTGLKKAISQFKSTSSVDNHNGVI